MDNDIGPKLLRRVPKDLFSAGEHTVLIVDTT